MRILYNNLWDNFTLVESQEDANYPVENTQDTRLVKVWRTSTASAASIVLAAGSAGLFVFKATTNLVQDPEDLTTGNWTTVNSIVTLSTLSYDDKIFNKVTNVGAAAGYVSQSFTATAGTTTPSFSATLRKGSSAGNTTEFAVYNLTGSANVIDIIVDFDNYPSAPGTVNNGVLHDYDWIDSETLELRAVCSAITVTDDLQVRCFGSDNATGDEYTYWTAIQNENSDYSTPYVDGARAKNSPDETVQMPSQFTVDMVVKPWFAYTSTINHVLYEWNIDGTHVCVLRWNVAATLFGLNYHDGTTNRWILSQQFDDGSAETNINQRIRIIASIDLTTGDTTGSRLIVIPLESGAIAEDTSWSGNIDALTSTFSTLSIGHGNESLQADIQFEYINVYAGNLVGTVGDSAAADALLAKMDTILKLNYLNKITVDSAAILNHNLSADATIKIQGNDFDSWTGPPVDETMAWRAETIVTFITSVSYPFWRFLITDPNVSDGYFEVGRFVLAEYLQIDPASLIEFPEKHVRNDLQSFSRSNQLYADQGSGWKELSYQFVNAADSMKDSVETMWNAVGKKKPILFMNYDTSFSVIGPLYCAIINDMTFNHKKYDKWDFGLDLREVD